MAPPIRWIVLGATGFVGANVISRICDFNETILAVGRRPHPTPFLATLSNCLYRDAQSVLRGSLCEIEFDRPTILNLIGASRERPTKHIRESNLFGVELTQHIAKEVKGAKSIFVSGYGLSESTTSVYARSKIDAERAHLDLHIPTAILRASYIVGRGPFKEDELMVLLRRTLDAGAKEIIFPAGGPYYIQPVHINDVADILVRMLRTSPFPTGAFELLGEQIPLDAFLERLIKLFKFPLVLEYRAFDWFVREAMLDANAPFSLSELGILALNTTGPACTSLFGVELRSISAILSDY